MKTITNFAEAHAALRPLYDNSRTVYTLDNMRRLMKFLGNPQEKFKTLHVAGTSGKTSTAYYVSALLETTGAKVGLTVSPHVDEVNERVQINHIPLEEAEFCAELTEFLDTIADSKVKPSYFELMVAFAYWEFAKKGVDYAVIEVGLGGLHDGTNVISRPDKVCIITDIGLDHMEILGDSLEKISAQKAGIIQAGNQVFIYGQPEEVMNVVRKTSTVRNARLHEITPVRDTQVAHLPLFQQRNFGLAKQSAEYVLRRDTGQKFFTAEQTLAASRILIPARMEKLSIAGKTLIVDGSHNPQKLGALAESMRAMYPNQKIAALVAFVKGDESRWQGGADALMQLAESLIITSFTADQDSPRSSVDPQQVADYCTGHGFEAAVLEPEAAEAFRKLQASPEPVLLVAGSFYLLNHIRPLIVKQ